MGGFFEVEIFNSGIFLFRKIWQIFFVWLDLSGDLVGIFWGYSKQSEDLWKCLRKYNQTSPSLEIWRYFFVLLMLVRDTCIWDKVTK